MDDFKIFEIEYELSPAIVKNQDSMWREFFSSFFREKEKRVNKLRKRRPWGRLFDVKMNEENGRIIPLKALLFKEIWYIMLF